MILQVGVKAFIQNKEGKYLLVKRSSEKYKSTKGSWDIVGGRIDTGTPLLENLRREIREETQLEITSEPVFIYAQDILPADGEKHVVRLTYVTQTDGEPVLDTSENVAYKWLALEELKTHEDLDVYVKEILEKNIVK